MQVYILEFNNKPLMPCSPRTARLLLKSKKAKIINKCPFTIKRIDNGFSYKQDITLGVDSGSKKIGLSATTSTKEVFSSEVTLRNDITELLATRRANRRTRRNRLRYRAPRFNNRVSSKNKGWLAPSIEHKIDSHIKAIENVHKILPISKTIIEVASFDIQKLKNPCIKGTEYQKGELLGFFNTREYVLFRDGYKCQHPKCKNKSKNPILHVHHIVYKSMGGGDAPSNLITLCNYCNTPESHKQGTILWDWCITKKKAGNFKDATFMGIMRWEVYNKLKDLYSNVELTYGYLTKHKRIVSKLPKTHSVDAYCIANNLSAIRSNYTYYQKFIRKHNRQIHKANLLKGGKKKLNQAPYLVKDFRLFDKVKYNNQECFVYGRRTTGYFDLRTLNGASIHKSASYKKLKLIQKRATILIERIKDGSSHD